MRDRAYLSGYALIILLAGLGLQHMWQRHMDLILLETDDRIGDTVNRVNGLLGESASHVNMLRLSAENTLRDLATRHQGTPGYYHHLEAARDGGADPAGFCTADDMSVTVHPIIPAVSGLGPVPAAESAAGQEVAMALLLGPQFVATKQNIPNMAWVYYISARHFIALYPFVACKEFRFSDALYEREFFSLGRPEADPGRTQFWTSAHISEAGNGLTATVGAPVYDMDGKFRGTIDINLTLKTLSQYLQSSRLTKGTLLIVNDQEQVLAHPALLDAALSAADSGIDPTSLSTRAVDLDAQKTVTFFGGNENVAPMDVSGRRITI